MAAEAAASPAPPTAAAAKVVVAVDLDEVLGYFVRPLLQFVSESAAYGPALRAAHPDVSALYDTFASYHFADVWPFDDDKSQEAVEAFFESGLFEGGLPVVTGAAEALRALLATGAFEFVLVTSRQHSIEDATRAWLDTHYRGIFREVVFGNHYGTSGAKRSKPDMCKALGAVAIVDDRVKYCSECAGELPSVLLFGDYAWNRAGVAKELPDAEGGDAKLAEAGVTRAKDWAAVSRLLIDLARERGHGDAELPT